MSSPMEYKKFTFHYRYLEMFQTYCVVRIQSAIQLYIYIAQLKQI